MRVKHKEVHDNVAQRFKQFGIGNVDNDEKDFMFEAVREDDAWPAPFNLVVKFKTEMASHDRHQLKSHYLKIQEKKNKSSKINVDLKDYQFFSDLQGSCFSKLKNSKTLQDKLFFNSKQQIMLDTPRLRFDTMIENTFGVKENSTTWN
jgi:hypothetical protein